MEQLWKRLEVGGGRKPRLFRSAPHIPFGRRFPTFYSLGISLTACGLPAGLRTLRLGLSGVRSLALALPLLTALDVNNAAELRCLELRCPLLLTVHMQACK